MKKPVIIFGAGKIADVIHHYAQNVFNRTVACFSIDDDYITSQNFNKLPVVPFNKIKLLYPPSDFDMFIAIGYQNMNALREEKQKAAEKIGYSLTSFISDNPAISKDLKHGVNCFIMPGAIIQPRVEIGNNVFIWGGAMIGHHTLIKNNTWVTATANISGNCEIGENCFLAVNSTVSHSVKIGNNCFLGANCLITKSTKNNEVFIQESTKALRLNTSQFLRCTNFTSI